VIVEFLITPSADERRKWTETPSMVTCCELSSTMPFFESCTVKPLNFQYGAPNNQSP
jgi:hypothetical protein